jgi:hypothetical protein
MVLPVVCAHLVEKDIPEENRDIIKSIDAAMVRYYLIKYHPGKMTRARENKVTLQSCRDV